MCTRWDELNHSPLELLRKADPASFARIRPIKV